MKRDITSSEFLEFIKSDENDKILRKSKNNKYPLYSDLFKNFSITAPFKNKKDLTENSEINAFISSGWNYLTRKNEAQKRYFRKEHYYLYYGDNVSNVINKNITTIKRDIKKDFPNINKINLSFKENEPAVITINLGYGKSYLTDYGIEQRKKKLNKIDENERRIVRNKEKIYKNYFKSLVTQLEKINTNTKLPENLKISSEEWLNMMIGSVENNPELKSLLDLKTLKELIYVYNQNDNILKNNKNIAMMLRGYVYSYQNKCYSKNEKTIDITYTETTTVKTKKYAGTFYIGSNSNDYKENTTVKIPIRFYKAYKEVESNYYSNSTKLRIGKYGYLLEEFLTSVGCGNGKSKYLDKQVLNVYKNRF